jgi:ribosomal protein L11 methyltransferase
MITPVDSSTPSPRSAPRIWHAVTVRAAPQLADAVGSRLLDLGAPGLESRDEDDAVVLTAHFAESAPGDELARLFDELAEIFPECERPEVEVRRIAESDWAENWKEHFPPLSVGQRLYIYPPWVTELPADRLAIVIDPGMAFGTGHHASTRGCLILLERLVGGFDAPDVLDIGTGSGILAIAAAKLGARAVHATDIDPLACDIAAENAAANDVTDRIAVEVGTAPAGRSFDIVLANLLAGDLIALADAIAGCARGGGVIVGSGLTTDEAHGVRSAWLAAGLTPQDEEGEDSWLTLAFRKRES